MKKIILSAVVTFAVAFTVAAQDGKALYDKECAKCHGANGNGDTKMGKKLGAKDYTKEAIDDAKAFKATKEGLKEGDKTLMKPIEGATDDQIKAVIAYMKTFKK
jgi:mono/diheme cytochrome c family protein